MPPKKSRSRSRSSSRSRPTTQGPKNLAKSAIFPRAPMMPGLIHVTGPSGSGKSTLISMLKNPHIVIMDTDAVTDPIFREFNGSPLPPKALDKAINSMIALEVMQAYEAARRQRKWLCIVGLAMGPIPQCELGFVLQVDPLTHWRQLSARTLKSVCSHSDEISRDIAAVRSIDDIRQAITKWSTEFEIRGPFPTHYGRSDDWYDETAKELKGYAYLDQEQIARAINRLGRK